MKKDEMYSTINNDRMRASVILLMSSSDLKACYREICIIFHIIRRMSIRIKELFYYLFNVVFACGTFIATISIISGDATCVLSLKN